MTATLLTCFAFSSAAIAQDDDDTKRSSASTQQSVKLESVGTKGKGGGSSAYGRERTKRVVVKVVPGDPDVQGPLDKEVIRRAVRQQRDALRVCYRSGLVRDPNLAGEVRVTFSITHTGNVSMAVVSSSTLEDAKVEACITQQLRRMIFPEPSDGRSVVVAYPFEFGM